MVKHLVIVESPAKAKTINKFLGKDYVVKASMGHVRDLPKSKLGVDPEDDFKPHYVNSRDKSKVIKELKDAAKKCDDVILAPDPDREGEAIAWHLKELLSGIMKDEEQFTRVTYNQITKAAIQKAFAAPTELDLHKVDAQQARRVLDRLVGYQVSPLLWRRIRGGSSAGRVQTVALRLVCEREKEILKFIPETFWIFGANVRKYVDPKDKFEIKLVRVDGGKGEVRDAELAKEIEAELQNCSLKVQSIATQHQQRRSKAPFITSTLQQAASSAYGFQPNRTMSLAQKLYEGVDLKNGEGTSGLITYMRTDSVHLAPEAIAQTRECIEKQFGPEYLPEKPNFFSSKGGAQEAHEAIRPTDLTLTPDDVKHVLDDQELKLYSLIWKRTMACQMAPAKIKRLTIEFDTDSTNHEYLFRASASEVVFPGFMAAWGKGLEEDDNEEEGGKLPPLVEGEKIELVEWLSEEKQTQPPKRFSEASLIKSLEENGVGRPSTYASIVSTLYSREYVDRESRSLRPTTAGMEVNDFLVGRLPHLFEVDFTAKMEETLDEIEDGKMGWTDMMKDFHGKLGVWIEEAKFANIDMDQLKVLLDLCDEVKEFNPPVKRGKKTYSDETFVQEMREAIEAGEAITDRQQDNINKVVARYYKKIDSLTPEKAEELGLTELIAKEAEANQPPREETLKKFELMANIEFAPARKVGKKTYDDKEFLGSLQEQVVGNRRLSENQIKYLDRLVIKYAAQIPDFETIAPTLGINDKVEEDNESGPLLELLKHVTTFNEPTVRGRKTWDDKEFAESLTEQFAAKKSLSPRQRGAMKTMIGRYSEQIPGYDEVWESLGLRDPSKPRRAPAKKKAAAKKKTTAKKKSTAKKKTSAKKKSTAKTK
ncbi:type I DNA topoisomerase [Kiritimatiellota bacterium B12222]|nr:type I DNA topoisomerase [Kiritimatiellota bacterium B12222]